MIVFSYIICATGATLTLFGILLSVWSFFVSNDNDRFYWGGGGFFIVGIGFLIYRQAFPYIQKKWDDYY